MTVVSLPSCLLLLCHCQKSYHWSCLHPHPLWPLPTSPTPPHPHSQWPLAYFHCSGAPSSPSPMAAPHHLAPRHPRSPPPCCPLIPANLAPHRPLPPLGLYRPRLHLTAPVTLPPWAPSDSTSRRRQPRPTPSSASSSTLVRRFFLLHATPTSGTTAPPRGVGHLVQLWPPSHGLASLQLPSHGHPRCDRPPPRTSHDRVVRPGWWRRLCGGDGGGYEAVEQALSLGPAQPGLPCGVPCRAWAVSCRPGLGMARPNS